MILPALHGNWIDLLIIVIVALYVLEGLERGFWNLLGDLVSFLGSLLIALKAYPFVSRFLIINFSLPNSFANAIGFVLSAIVAQTILGMLVSRALEFVPDRLRHKWWSRGLSVVPAVLDSTILIAAFLTLLVALPISPKIKVDVVDSRIGGFLVERTSGLNKILTDIFGGAFNDTLTFLTIEPKSNERINLPYKPSTLSVDYESEQKMLVMVNVERAKVGAKPLVMDKKLQEVARAHSRDMWVRGYFAHTDPDGKDPFDRMKEAGIGFTTAGENIALAPTLELAHQGLMNSPGHKRNILDPDFGRIGIGVIDGGIYGKMFTQDFAD